MTVAEQRAKVCRSVLVDFSLARLPIQTHAVYSVLLMIPIGALIMVLMRNLVGDDAFGTIMPVLIALSFRETQLIWEVVPMLVISIVSHKMGMKTGLSVALFRMVSIAMTIERIFCNVESLLRLVSRGERTG